MKISGSKLQLATLCSYWARDDVDTPQSEGGPAAESGTRIHHAIATGDTSALSPEEMDLYLHWLDNMASHVGGEAFMEESFAYNPVTGDVILPEKVGHDYVNLPEGYVPMTVDAFYIGPNGELTVVDWKTGRHAVTPAKDNAQLTAAALTLATLYQVDTVKAGIGYVRTGKYDWVELNALDMQEFRETLKATLAALPTAQATPGTHCRELYCPMLGQCPATSAAMAQMTKLPIVYTPSAIQNADHARYQYEVLRTVQAATASAWGALRLWAEQNGPVPLEGGKAWGSHTVRRESIDMTPEAVAALRSILGEHADTALEISSSKAAIERAARLVSKESGGTIKGIKETVLSALSNVGAVKVSESTKFEES